MQCENKDLCFCLCAQVMGGCVRECVFNGMGCIVKPHRIRCRLVIENWMNREKGEASLKETVNAVSHFCFSLRGQGEGGGTERVRVSG